MKETKQYTIHLDKHTEVPVSQEVYRAYIRPKWRERKQEVRNRKVISLDEIGEEALGEQSVTGEKLKSVEDLAIEETMLELLDLALEELEPEEKQLIDFLFYQDRSEREYEKVYGVPRRTVAYKKAKILKKLKNFFKFF